MTNDTTLSAAACVGTTPDTLMLPEYRIATTDAPGSFGVDEALGLLTLDWGADDSVDPEADEAGAVLGAATTLDETVGGNSVDETVARSTALGTLVAATVAAGRGCSDDDDRTGLDCPSSPNQSSEIAADSNPTTTITTTSAHPARTRLCRGSSV